MKADTPEAPAIRLQIGETLRAARESRGWSLQDVAAQLNLTRQMLADLETGNFGELPHTFARGYLRAYAKLLGLDAQQIANDFDRCSETVAVSAGVQQLGPVDEPRRVSQRLLQLVSIVVSLALLAAGFYWWQAHNPEPAERSAIPEHVEVESADGTTQLHPLTEPEDAALAEMQTEVPQPPENLSSELIEPAPQDEPQEQSQAATSQPAAVQPAAPATTDAKPPAAAPQVSAPVPAAAPEPAPASDSASSETANAPSVAAANPAPAAGEGLLEIAFSDTCWIEIVDGNGKILHSSLKRRGDSLQITGKKPLKLHMGYARGATVRFNGQAVDVASHARGETARLILGQ